MFHELMRESMERSDRGVGEIWEPATGHGLRPSAIYAEGMTSLANADIEMDVTTKVAKAHLLKDKVIHVVVSFNERESQLLTNEQVIKAASAVFHHSAVGLADHQKVLAVHRDTLVYDQSGKLIDGNVHVHAMINAIHPETLRPWIRQGDYGRFHYAARDVEIHSRDIVGQQLEHDRGSYVIREFDGGKRIERATDAERDAWTHERMEQRLQERIMRTFEDYREHETPQSWAAAEIDKPIRDYLAEARSRNEAPRWVDMHLITAAAGGRLERSEGGQLQVRWMERASDRVTLDEGERRALGELARDNRGWKKALLEHGDWLYRKQYDALRGEMQVRGDTMRERPSLVRDSDTPVVVLDHESLAGPLSARKSDYEARERRLKWLDNYRTPIDAEREFATALRRDPGLVSRELVASGDALFTREHIDNFIGKRNSDPDVLTELSQHVEQSDGSLRILGVDADLPIYTTEAELSLEERVAAKWLPLIRERDTRFDPAVLEQAIREVETREGIRLSDEQRHVLYGLERRSSWTQGWSGTGKTSIQQVTALCCERTGRAGIGLATSSRAAERLEHESGAKAMNITLALVNEEMAGRKVIPRGAIMMIDESSMVDMRHFDKLLNLVRERDVTIIGMGDRAQLPPIGAGDVARKAEYLHNTREGYFSTLTEVRRQRGDIEWMRPVVADLGRSIIEDDAAGIRRNIETMAEHEVFQFRNDRKTTFAAAADEYVVRRAAGEEVIVAVQDNRDARHLNREVHDRLGLGAGVAFKNDEGNLEISRGERIRFTKNNTQIGVYNGYSATVSEVTYDSRRRKWQIQATLDRNGKEVRWDPRSYTHYKHGYVGTVHAAQAQSVQSNIAVITRPAEARLTNVATTRGETALSIYVSREAYATPSDLAQGIAARNPAKLDAMLYREYEAKFGGRDSYWAINVRRAQADERHPLRREHRRDMAALGKERSAQFAAVSERYHRRITAPGTTPAQKERFEYAERREYQRIAERMSPVSFVTWAAEARRAQRIEREGQRIDAAGEIRSVRQRERERDRATTTREQQLARELERTLQRTADRDNRIDRDAPPHTR